MLAAVTSPAFPLLSMLTCLDTHTWHALGSHMEALVFGKYTTLQIFRTTSLLGLQAHTGLDRASNLTARVRLLPQ